MDIARKLEDTKKGAQDRPVEDCVIADSGELELEKPFAVAKEPVPG